MSKSKLPSIMCGIGSRGKFEISIFSRVRERITQRLLDLLNKDSILFYPGAGKDFGPIEFFINEGILGTAIYADYLIKEHQVSNLIAENLVTHPAKIEKLKPLDFGYAAWSNFWPSDDGETITTDHKGSYSLLSQANDFQNKKFNLIYFGTEAVQTYVNLLQTPFKPDIVILHDHGFGGNWTHFGGANEMYQFASRLNALPEILLVDKNTNPWPGYVRESEYFSIPGQSNGFERAIFKQDL